MTPQPTLSFANRFGSVVRSERIRPLRMIGLLILPLAGMLGGCSRESATPATTVDPMVQWCDVAAELTTLADGGESPTATANTGDTGGAATGGSERDTLDKVVALLEKAKSVAPPEISADVASAADSAKQISKLLESANYDDSNISDDMLARYQSLSEQLAQASAVITNFNQRYCGVGTSDPRRDQTIADLVLRGLTEEEASCLYDALDVPAADPSTKISDTLDQSAAEVSSGQELFESCGIDSARATEIAAILASETSQ